MSRITPEIRSKIATLRKQGFDYIHVARSVRLPPQSIRAVFAHLTRKRQGTSTKAALKAWETRRLSEKQGKTKAPRSATTRVVTAVRRPFVIVRIGWMKRYAGSQPGDERAISGAKFLRTRQGPGDERFNFARVTGHVFGYFPPSSNATQPSIKLRRLQPTTASMADHVEGVLVIFIGPAPDAGGQRVIGWYSNERSFVEVNCRISNYDREPHSFLKQMRRTQCWSPNLIAPASCLEVETPSARRISATRTAIALGRESKPGCVES